MDNMLLVGLFQTDALIKEPDEYEEAPYDADLLGLPDNRKLIKEGEYKQVATTIDLSNVEYPLAWRIGDNDVTKIVHKSGNSILINTVLAEFEMVWMQYKASIHHYELIIEEPKKDENTEA